MGYSGSERTTRRIVAQMKKHSRQEPPRSHMPWITEPGLWLQEDFAGGPKDQRGPHRASLCLGSLEQVLRYSRSGTRPYPRRERLLLARFGLIMEVNGFATYSAWSQARHRRTRRPPAKTKNDRDPCPTPLVVLGAKCFLRCRRCQGLKEHATLEASMRLSARPGGNGDSREACSEVLAAACSSR